MLGLELKVRLPADAAAHLTGPRLPGLTCLGLKDPGHVVTIQARVGALGEGQFNVLEVCMAGLTQPTT